ncbi:MAG: hypothetical protein ACI90V_012992 [Bacillariaceae sp.]|jgi:hypothetical protein
MFNDLSIYPRLSKKRHLSAFGLEIGKFAKFLTPRPPSPIRLPMILVQMGVGQIYLLFGPNLQTCEAKSTM